MRCLRTAKPSFAPGTVTYVPTTSSVGVQPIYTTTAAPLAAISEHTKEKEATVKEIFRNDLFEVILRLQTVRSATEIDARELEKLVLLSPTVLLFSEEFLTPVIQRTFQLCQEQGKLPEPPPDFPEEAPALVYDNIFSTAQKAQAAGPMERFLQVLGSVAGIYPEVAAILDSEEFIRHYAKALNVPAFGLHSRQEVQEIIAAQAQAQQQQIRLDQAKLAAETQATAGNIPQ